MSPHAYNWDVHGFRSLDSLKLIKAALIYIICICLIFVCICVCHSEYYCYETISGLQKQTFPNRFLYNWYIWKA